MRSALVGMFREGFHEEVPETVLGLPIYSPGLLESWYSTVVAKIIWRLSGQRKQIKTKMCWTSLLWSGELRNACPDLLSSTANLLSYEICSVVMLITSEFDRQHPKDIVSSGVPCPCLTVYLIWLLVVAEKDATELVLGVNFCNLKLKRYRELKNRGY